MADATGVAVTCEGCGSKYKLKAEFAGRSVKCKCGAVMNIPEASAANVLADMASDQAACPSCNAAMASGAIVCVQCGYNTQTGQALGAEVGVIEEDEPGGAVAVSMSREEQEMLREHLVKERILPLILMTVGLGLNLLLARSIMSAYGMGDSAIGMLMALLGIVLFMAVGVAFMTGICFLMAMMLDITFGTLDTAAIKLAAIFLFGNGAYYGLMWMLGGFDPGMMGIAIQYGVYFTLIAWLFGIEIDEACMVAGAFIIGKIAAGFIILSLVWRALMF